MHVIKPSNCKLINVSMTEGSVGCKLYYDTYIISNKYLQYFQYLYDLYMTCKCIIIIIMGVNIYILTAIVVITYYMYNYY